MERAVAVQCRRVFPGAQLRMIVYLQDYQLRVPDEISCAAKKSFRNSRTPGMPKDNVWMEEMASVYFFSFVLQSFLCNKIYERFSSLKCVTLQAKCKAYFSCLPGSLSLLNPSQVYALYGNDMIGLITATQLRPVHFLLLYDFLMWVIAMGELALGSRRACMEEEVQECRC